MAPKLLNAIPCDFMNLQDHHEMAPLNDDTQVVAKGIAKVTTKVPTIRAWDSASTKIQTIRT